MNIYASMQSLETDKCPGVWFYENESVRNQPNYFPVEINIFDDFDVLYIDARYWSAISPRQDEIESK